MEFVPSIVVLGLLALIAWRQARVRRFATNNVGARKGAARMLLTATLVQAVHFIEEAITGFHQAFPALFGLPPISLPVFVVFNVTLLIIWFASIAGVYAGRTAALFAAWFLALAGLLNGIAHPLLATATGGYFPGLITSPLIGFVGLLLWQRLQRATGQSPATIAN